jgi:hypothetical protein
MSNVSVSDDLLFFDDLLKYEHHSSETTIMSSVIIVSLSALLMYLGLLLGFNLAFAFFARDFKI